MQVLRGGRNCKVSSDDVPNTASQAVIGPPTFTGGTDVADDSTIASIAICNNATADYALCNSNTGNVAFAVVDTNDVTLANADTTNHIHIRRDIPTQLKSFLFIFLFIYCRLACRLACNPFQIFLVNPIIMTHKY